MNTTLEVEPQALAHREPPVELPLVAPLPITPKATAQENRVEEVNEALLPAYQKASELKLTAEEAKALREPFPDTEVEIRPFDGLIYVPHITISDRLTDVIGPGQWSMVRRREWMEGDRIYGEFVMKIRGCYVGESVGSMEYHPTNAKMNYADALEGTRGECLRRIAGKDLGCGSLVWKPSYCRKWVETNAAKVWCSDQQGKKKPMWRRKTDPPIDIWPWKEEGGSTRPEAKPPINVATRPAVAPKPAPVASSEQDKSDHAVLLKAAYKLIPESMRADVARYLTDFKGEDGRSFHWLLPTEGIEELSTERLRQLVNNWSDGFAPRIDHWILQNDQVPGAEAPPAEAGPDFTLKGDDAPWRQVVVHFGQHKGKRLDELEKNTMWGFWANFKPVASEKYGVSQQDTELRAALDAAGKHYAFTPPKA